MGFLSAILPRVRIFAVAVFYFLIHLIQLCFRVRILLLNKRNCTLKILYPVFDLPLGLFYKIVKKSFHVVKSR